MFSGFCVGDAEWSSGDAGAPARPPRSATPPLATRRRGRPGGDAPVAGPAVAARPRQRRGSAAAGAQGTRRCGISPPVRFEAIGRRIGRRVAAWLVRARARRCRGRFAFCSAHPLAGYAPQSLSIAGSPRWLYAALTRTKKYWFAMLRPDGQAQHEQGYLRVNRRKDASFKSNLGARRTRTPSLRPSWDH